MLNNRHMSGHQSTKMYYRQDAHNPDRHVNVKTTWRGPMDGDYITIEDIPEVEQVWSECSPTNTPTNSVIFKKSETQRRSVMKLASGFSTSVLNVLSSHNITSDEDLRRRLRKEHGGLDKWEYEANYG